VANLRGGLRAWKAQGLARWSNPEQQQHRVLL
jgi:hypothetical protein